MLTNSRRPTWLRRVAEALGVLPSSKPTVLKGWIEYFDDHRIGHAMANAVFTRCGLRSVSSYNRAALDGPLVSCPSCVAAGAR